MALERIDRETLFELARDASQAAEELADFAFDIYGEHREDAQLAGFLASIRRRADAHADALSDIARQCDGDGGPYA